MHPLYDDWIKESPATYCMKPFLMLAGATIRHVKERFGGMHYAATTSSGHFGMGHYGCHRVVFCYNDAGGFSTFRVMAVPHG